MSSASGTPYIGSKISLISKAQIRYEGILSSVDTEKSTVALAKVKSYGTEGRQSDRPVPPKDEIYGYIIFRGSDIKDITVSEPPKAHHGLPHDPAIVQSSVGSSSGSYVPRWSPYRDMMPSYNQLAASSLLNQQYAAALGLAPAFQGIPARRGPMVEQAVQTVPLASAAPKRGQTPAPQQSRRPVRSTQPSSREPAQPQRKAVPSSSSQAAPQNRTAKVQVQSNDENQRPRRKQGSRRSRNRNKGQLLVKNAKATTLQFESDFDFESANAQFNKNEIEKEVPAAVGEKKGHSGVEVQETPGTEDVPAEKYYDKSKCFFDNISSDLKPRRTTWAEEKKLNIETFGVPGRFLRGRGFRGYRATRGQGDADQQPLPKVGSARV